MDLLHKTVIPCNDLLFCTVRQIVSSDVVETIMIYRHRVEFGTVKYVPEFQKASIHFPQSVPLELSLIWGAVRDQYFFSINENFDFIVSDMTNFPKFTKLFTTRLENIPNTYETKSISYDLNFICIALNSGTDLLIINVTNPTDPQFCIFSLNVKNIFSIVPGPEKNSFAILVENTKESKSVYYLNSETLKIFNKIKVEPTANQLVYSPDSNHPQLFVVSSRKITGIDSQTSFTTKSDILLVSNIVGNQISAILNDKSFSLIVFSLSNKTEHLYKDGYEFEKIFTLPNSILVLYSDGYYIILRIPTATKSKNNSHSFSDIQQLEVLQNKNTGVQSLALINNSLFSLGEFGLMTVTNQDPGDIDGSSMNAKSDGKLFSLGKELQFYSTKNATIALENNFCKKPFKFIQDQFSIDILLYNNSLVQVMNNGVFANGKRVLKDLSKITYSATNSKSHISFVREKTEIFLYTNNFSFCCSYQFEDSKIDSVAMDENFIAISIFKEFKGRICLFDYNLDFVGIEIETPSPVESLVFLNNGTELYAFSLNGTIMKIAVNESGLTNLISYVYAGGRTENSIKVTDKAFAFISNSNIFLYIKDHIISTGIDNTISIGFDSELLSIVRKFESRTESETKSKKKNKKEQDENEQSFDYVFSSIDCFEFDDSHITVFPDSEHPALRYRGFGETGFLLRDNAIESMSNRDLIKSYSIKQQPLTFTCTEIKPGIFHIIAVFEEKHDIIVLKYKSIENKFKFLFNETFDSEINSIEFYRDTVLLALNGEIKIAEIFKKSFKYFKAFIPSFGDDHPITCIAISNDYIWVSYLNLKLAVYKYVFNVDRFSIVSEFVGDFNVTAMNSIDDVTMAVGQKNGEISFYQIPLNVSIGAFVQPFEKNGLKIIPKLDCIFNCSAKDEISSFVTIPHCIIYSTTVGAIGAFIHGLDNVMLMKLHKIQQRIRNISGQMIGFSQKSRSAMCGNKSIVDYDQITFYQKFIDPDDNENLFDFYIISMITNIMQYLTF